MLRTANTDYCHRSYGIQITIYSSLLAQNNHGIVQLIWPVACGKRIYIWYIAHVHAHQSHLPLISQKFIWKTECDQPRYTRMRLIMAWSKSVLVKNVPFYLLSYEFSVYIKKMCATRVKFNRNWLCRIWHCTSNETKEGSLKPETSQLQLI